MRAEMKQRGMIRDAVIRWLDLEPDSTERRFRQLEKDAREIMLDMHDALEKLAAWAAREAKRQAKTARDELTAATTDVITPPQAGDLESRKRQLRGKLARGELRGLGQ